MVVMVVTVVVGRVLRAGARGWGSRRVEAVAEDILELGGGDVGAVLGRDGGPEGGAAGLVDGAEPLRVDGGRVDDAVGGVDAQAAEGLGRALRRVRPRFGQQDLLVRAGGRRVRRAEALGRGHVAVLARGAALRRRLGDGAVVVLDAEVVVGRVRRGPHRAGRGGRADGAVAFAAVARVRELVVVETAGELRLLQVRGDVLVGHLLHPGLEEICFLQRRC